MCQVVTLEVYSLPVSAKESSVLNALEGWMQTSSSGEDRVAKICGQYCRYALESQDRWVCEVRNRARVSLFWACLRNRQTLRWK